MVSVECCGQFIASKQAIRRNPRQVYLHNTAAFYHNPNPKKP
jgi:hypothetical protein